MPKQVSTGLADALIARGLKVELSGPTIQDDVRRLINRYGASAVKAALNSATKVRRGPKEIKDWTSLWSIVDADARNWLEGGNPFEERSNRSIAKDFSDKNPGHSRDGTHRRIMRKLSADRVKKTLYTAYYLSERDFPYEAHLRALRELAAGEWHAEYWKIELNRALADIEDYESKFGVTTRDQSIAEIRERARNAVFVPMPRGSDESRGGLVSFLGLPSLQAMNKQQDG